MGTHGMGGMRNIFLGSVAMRVIHAADRPVTLIK
jgi:nucleotide-binding universal stress UspA family protein